MKKSRFMVISVGIAMVLLLVAANWVRALFTKSKAWAMHSCVESLASAVQLAVQTNSIALPNRLGAAPQPIDERLLAELAKIGSLDCAHMQVNAAGHFCDAWGSEILIKRSSPAEGTTNLTVVSLGPDRKQGTRDDIEASRSLSR